MSTNRERALYDLLRGPKLSLVSAASPIDDSAFDLSRLPKAEHGHFIERLDATRAMAWLEERTVCIGHVTDDGNPTSTGSGVLLKIADVGFIVSAAHVLCKTEDQTLNLIVAPNSGTAGYVLLPKVDITRTSDSDHADFGFVRLPTDIDAYLSKRKTFVRLAETTLEAKPSGGAYTVLGYPREWARFDPVKELVSLRPLCCTTHLHRGSLTAVTEGLSIALAYPPNGFSFVKGPRERLPELNGISGCGIWRMYTRRQVGRLRDWDTSSIRLAGIDHAFVGRKAIRGVLISHVIDCIGQRYPELAPSIDLAR